MQEKTKNYYSILTYGLKDATAHNNSKTFVALKFLKPQLHSSVLYFSSCAKTSSKHGFACAPTPVGHKLFLNLAMPFNVPWPCSFPRPMAIKQAHGPINLATQIEAVFSHVLLAENQRNFIFCRYEASCAGKTKTLLFYHDVRAKRRHPA